MELPERVAAALQTDALSTEQLAALLLETGGERCHRRARILYYLRRYLTSTQSTMSASSSTHRFKKDFRKQKAIIEVDGKTKAVTAENIADEDVPQLIQYGYGHLIEALPKEEAKEEPRSDLHKLNKSELVKLHAEVGADALTEDATKAQLIEAIEAKQSK